MTREKELSVHVIPYIQLEFYTALAALSLILGAGAVMLGLFAKKGRKLFYAGGGALGAVGLILVFLLTYPNSLAVLFLLLVPALFLAGALVRKARKPLFIAGGIVGALGFFMLVLWFLYGYIGL